MTASYINPLPNASECAKAISYQLIGAWDITACRNIKVSLSSISRPIPVIGLVDLKDITCVIIRFNFFTGIGKNLSGLYAWGGRRLSMWNLPISILRSENFRGLLLILYPQKDSWLLLTVFSLIIRRIWHLKTFWNTTGAKLRHLTGESTKSG